MKKVNILVKSEITHYFEDFLEDASQIEKDGLDIIFEAYQTRGEINLALKFPEKRSNLSQDFDRLRNE